MDNIRNFSIIAHIDHGKSTLADRMLELTGTVEKRKMREQVLDSMELERERGITIKMRPVRMNYEYRITNNEKENQYSSFAIPHSSNSKQTFVLNLIDTPGHIDFYYEVSRALKAVEGSLLLVDATQGVQAQTVTTLSAARAAGLVIIPVVTKIDAALARIKETAREVEELLGCASEDIVYVSGKTGEGVAALLSEIVRRVPPPKSELPKDEVFRSLVFDFTYSNHTGVTVYVRAVNGTVSRGEKLRFAVAGSDFKALEVGVFTPEQSPKPSLLCGEIGYIVTGIKEPGIASVGDTVAAFADRHQALAGYEEPRPVVWASLYPENQDDFGYLKTALSRLRLSDSSLVYEEESSGALGRGFRCGFLGMLHLEIVTERLRREFSLSLTITAPSITYEVLKKKGKREAVYSAAFFPDDHEIFSVDEPWVKITVITPPAYLAALVKLLFTRGAEVGETSHFGESRLALEAGLPLSELVRGLFDSIKSLSSGFASLSYEMAGKRPADVLRMDILVAGEVVPAFSRVVPRRFLETEAKATVEKLSEILPRQLFAAKIQAQASGRIIASRTLPALRKDVTGYLYGGDVTRKKKLWEKQKRGKKRLKEIGKVNIPHDVFLKMMRSE
ncbi:elongation factor 4 [Patescibacteria group bacterium]|nr:MAG: elongation factor 4 [Patescibacteria group bacterium]